MRSSFVVVMSLAILLAAGSSNFAFAAAVCTGPAFAQSEADRTVEQYSCKDVMREGEGAGAREVAIAFLHGYLLGKSGTSKFNLAALERQSDARIEYWLDNPAARAEAAMIQSKDRIIIDGGVT